MTQTKRWIAVLWLLCLVFGWPALASEATGVPALRGRVNDYAAVLGAGAGAIEAKLSAQERATGHQVVVLTVADLGGMDIESYANEVFHAWKLGRKGVDDGVLIVLAVKERSARIEVGYGLEGTLTDLASSRILREDMHPHFAAGDMAGGMEAGVDAVLGALAGQELANSEVPPSPRTVSLRDLFYTWLSYLLALLFMALFFWCAVATGGVLPLGYLLIPSAFALAIWGWPVALGGAAGATGRRLCHSLSADARAGVQGSAARLDQVRTLATGLRGRVAVARLRRQGQQAAQSRGIFGWRHPGFPAWHVIPRWQRRRLRIVRFGLLRRRRRFRWRRCIRSVVKR